jgi:DNA-binding protein YbaB
VVSDLSGAGFDRLLEQTKQALESAKQPAQQDNAEPLHGSGEAADGRVQVRVASPGRVEELTIDPRLLREGSEEVAAKVVEAVNQALDDLRAQAIAQLTPAVDPAALAGKLEELQTESMRTMEQFATAISDAFAKLPKNND